MPKTKKDDRVFDFEAFTAANEEQQVLAENRQRVQMETARRTADIQDRNAKLHREYDHALNPLRTEIARGQQKATHARQLADSQSPLDHLRLLGLQTMDPAGYRRDVRSARLAEDLQRASAIGQTYGVSQQALQAELLASANDLEIAKLQEAIGREKLTAIQDEAAMMSANLEASRTLMLGAIEPLDLTAVQDAIAKSKDPAGNGTVNIAGIEVPTRVLEDRALALEDRDYNAAVKRAALADKNEELFRKTQRKDLDGMTANELMKLRSNHYTADDGEAYHRDDVEQAYTRRLTVEDDERAAMMRDYALTNFDKNHLNQEMNNLSIVKGRFSQNSPIQPAVREYEAALAMAANFADPSNAPEIRLQAFMAIADARKAFDAALVKQAQVDAPGDTKKQALLTEFYRGNPIPIEGLSDMITSRLTANRTIADLVPAPVAAAIEREYREQIKANQQAGMWSNPSAEERKLQQVEAVNNAIEKVIGQQIQERTPLILGGQVLDKAHPLYGKWTPQKLNNTYLEADNEAAGIIRTENSLNDEQFQAVRTLTPRDDVDVLALNSQLRFLEDSIFLEKLEAEQLGLGTAVAEWWRDRGNEYIKNSQAMTKEESYDFKNHAFRAYSNQREQLDMYGYGQRLLGVEPEMRNISAKRQAEYIKFGSNPEYAQVALLEMAAHLEPDEKGQFFDQFLKPLLADSRARGLSYEETNLFIERSLMNAQPETPEGKALLKGWKRDRAEVTRSHEKMMYVPNWLMSLNPLGSVAQYTGLMSNRPPARVGAIDWYQQRLGKGETSVTGYKSVPGGSILGGFIKWGDVAASSMEQKAKGNQ